MDISSSEDSSAESESVSDSEDNSDLSTEDGAVDTIVGSLEVSAQLKREKV